jgi:hypothetical protein
MRAKVRYARGDWPSAKPAALDGQMDIDTRILMLPSLSLPIRTCHPMQNCSTSRTELDTDVNTGTHSGQRWCTCPLASSRRRFRAALEVGLLLTRDLRRGVRRIWGGEQARSSLLLLVCSSLAASASTSNLMSFPHWILAAAEHRQGILGL